MNTHDTLLRHLFDAARASIQPDEPPPGFATRVLASVRAAREDQYPLETLALRFLAWSAAATALTASAILTPTAASTDEVLRDLDPVAEVMDAF